MRSCLSCTRLAVKVTFSGSVLSTLAMMATVFEGREISPQELLGVLQGSMRQRSIDRLPRREYVLGFLKQHPP